MKKKKVTKVTVAPVAEVATPKATPKKEVERPEDTTGFINDCFSMSSALLTAENIKTSSVDKAKQRVMFAVAFKAYLKAADKTIVQDFIDEKGKTKEEAASAQQQYLNLVKYYKSKLTLKEQKELGVKPRKGGAHSGKPKPVKKGDNIDGFSPVEMVEYGLKRLNNKALLMAKIEEAVALFNETYGEEGVKVSLTFTKKEGKQEAKKAA